MGKKGVILTQEDFLRTNRAVAHFEADPRFKSRPIPQRNRVAAVDGVPFRFGVLDGDLSAPATVTGTPTTAIVSQHSLDGTLSDTGDNFTLTNFDPLLQGTAGAFVIAANLSGSTWFPIWIGCVAQNEKQTIIVSGTPTGGTFGLTNFGEEAAINYNDSAANVKTALVALNSFASADITATGGPLPGTDVVIEFTGDYADTDMPMMVLSDNSLTGGSSPDVTINETEKGCCN